MLFALLTAILLHPVHETVAEVEWNPQTNRIEVALRLDALDEQWLTKSSPPDAEMKDLALKYLATHFQLANQPRFSNEAAKLTDAHRPKYRWVGRKPDGTYVWWYFEIEPPASVRPTWIRQRMFFERDQRYTNRVIVLDQKPRHAVTLTAEKPIARLDNLDDESAIDDQPEEPKS